MSNITREQIIDWLSNQTVLEISELIKELETKWNITATINSGNINTSTSNKSEENEEIQEKTEFDVVLSSVGDKKISVIKMIREITGLGLQESKALVDKTPSNIKEKIDKTTAEEIKSKLESVGAVIDIK